MQGASFAPLLIATWPYRTPGDGLSSDAQQARTVGVRPNLRSGFYGANLATSVEAAGRK